MPEPTRSASEADLLQEKLAYIKASGVEAGEDPDALGNYVREGYIETSDEFYQKVIDNLPIAMPAIRELARSAETASILRQTETTWFLDEEPQPAARPRRFGGVRKQ